MAIGPHGDQPPLTEQELRVVNDVERELDDAIRHEPAGSKVIFLWRAESPLRPAQIRVLERKYRDAGWSKVSVAPTAGGACVITLLP